MKALIAPVFAAALLVAGAATAPATAAVAVGVHVGTGHAAVVVHKHRRHIRYCRAHHWRNHHRGACRLWGWKWVVR